MCVQTACMHGTDMLYRGRDRRLKASRNKAKRNERETIESSSYAYIFGMWCVCVYVYILERWAHLFCPRPMHESSVLITIFFPQSKLYVSHLPCKWLLAGWQADWLDGKCSRLPRVCVRASECVRANTCAQHIVLTTQSVR